MNEEWESLSDNNPIKIHQHRSQRLSRVEILRPEQLHGHYILQVNGLNERERKAWKNETEDHSRRLKAEMDLLLIL